MVMEQRLAPVPGGTGRYAGEVAAALCRRSGVAVTGWVAWHRDLAAARIPGMGGPRRLPLGHRGLSVAWERGTGPVPAGRPDVVHAPTLLAPPRRGRPLVVTIHDAVPWTHPETLTRRGAAWHRRMAERVAGEADLVIVPTHAVAAALSAHLELPRVEVVGEGVSSAFTDPRPAEEPPRQDPADGGYLLSLATMEPRKGLDVLVRALAQPGAPDLPLLVVGQPGWGDVDPGRLAASVGLAPDRLRILGRVPDAQLVPLLARATALVVPSRAEGFGLPVLEGMALGVPVVTSTDPALVEVGGPATATAPVGDAVALARVLGDVVADPARRAAMASAGRERARRYTWDAAAQRLAALYADLLG